MGKVGGVLWTDVGQDKMSRIMRKSACSLCEIDQHLYLTASCLHYSGQNVPPYIYSLSTSVYQCRLLITFANSLDPD